MQPKKEKFVSAKTRLVSMVFNRKTGSCKPSNLNRFTTLCGSKIWTWKKTHNTQWALFYEMVQKLWWTFCILNQQHQIGLQNILYTLYNVLLRIARNLLETRENVKILTHPVYHPKLHCFFFKKKNSKWPIFQNGRFSKFFCENFTDWSLG